MRNKKIENDRQLDLFGDPGKELLTALAGVQVDHLTPLQAAELLRQWKEKWGKR
jgi:hypothetical protein